MSYLTNRQHLTKLNDIESDLKVLDVGVPQGSILGPILFLLFIKGVGGSEVIFCFIAFSIRIQLQVPHTFYRTKKFQP